MSSRRRASADKAITASIYAARSSLARFLLEYLMRTALYALILALGWHWQPYSSTTRVVSLLIALWLARSSTAPIYTSQLACPPPFAFLIPSLGLPFSACLFWLTARPFLFKTYMCLVCASFIPLSNQPFLIPYTPRDFQYFESNVPFEQVCPCSFDAVGFCVFHSEAHDLWGLENNQRGFFFIRKV